jgi:periplasmic divalent cation tolerance protein
MTEEALDRPMAAYFCYVTAPSRDEAVAIGRALVEERLAAAANVIDGATSLYWWQGRLEEASEAVLTLRTRADLVERVTERIRQLHGYRCRASWRCRSPRATPSTSIGSRP